MRCMFVLPLALAAFNFSATSSFANDVWDIELNCPGIRDSGTAEGRSYSNSVAGGYVVRNEDGRVYVSANVRAGENVALVRLERRGIGYLSMAQQPVTRESGLPAMIIFRDSRSNCYDSLTRR